MVEDVAQTDVSVGAGDVPCHFGVEALETGQAFPDDRQLAFDLVLEGDVGLIVGKRLVLGRGLDQTGRLMNVV